MICSYHFASAKSMDVRLVPWDLVVIDEAHRLRNVFRTSSKMARTIAETVKHAPKLLLTATPLQNSLMELYDLLTANGYDGQIVMINGSKNDPHSQIIYERWLVRHAGQDIATGSKSVDMKAAITEEFRDHATILIATEAAAEGVNLQFCSLIVNFDLPWNPQRNEQRIGRCHRYGQKYDVVVVNFINRRNHADQRVFELLSERFQLFDGVFGSSDEVLGVLESGVDIERRIAAVYQSCWSPDEIAKALDQLQAELDEQIQARMASTRRNLLENFDQEVHDCLRIHRDKTLESLSDRERWLLALTRAELGADAQFDPVKPRFHYTGADAPHGDYTVDWREAEANGEMFYRQDHRLAALLIERAVSRPLNSALVTFDYSTHGAIVSVLQPLIGRSSWLELASLPWRRSIPRNSSSSSPRPMTATGLTTRRPASCSCSRPPSATMPTR